MTGQGVERTPRTAYPGLSVSPTGVSSLMPPHIQGAERRTERRAGRTGSRWSLRALVLGGLVIGGWVIGGLTTAPGIGLLPAAAQPLETVPIGGPTLTQQQMLAPTTVAARRTDDHPIADQPVDDQVYDPAVTPMHRPSHLTSDGA